MFVAATMGQNQAPKERHEISVAPSELIILEIPMSINISFRRDSYPSSELLQTERSRLALPKKSIRFWNEPVRTGNAGASPALSAERETVTALRSLTLNVAHAGAGEGARVPSVSLFLPATTLFGQSRRG